MSNEQFSTEAKAEMKKEYMRGIEESKAFHTECHTTFLELVKDKVTRIINESDTLEEAQDELEELIQFMDEYTEGQVTVEELTEKLETEKEKTVIEGLDTDEVISINEFVRDDF